MAEPLKLMKLDLGDDDDDDKNGNGDDSDDDDEFLMAGPVFASRSPTPAGGGRGGSEGGGVGTKSSSSSSSWSDPGPSRKRKLRELLKTIPTSCSTVGARHTGSGTQTQNNNSSSTTSGLSQSDQTSPSSNNRESNNSSGIHYDEDRGEATVRKRLRLEKSARNAVEELRLDAVRGVTDCARLGFVKEDRKCGGKKSTVVYFPAVIADESSLEVQKLRKLQKQKTARRNICVQYLGVGYMYANDYGYITKNQWEGLSGDGTDVDDEDERRLATHLKQIAGHADFIDNPLSLKTEELAIRECWKRVKQQQDNHGQDLLQKQHLMNSSPADDQKRPSELEHDSSALPTNVSQDSHDEAEYFRRKATQSKSLSDHTSVSSTTGSSDESDDDERDSAGAQLESGVSRKRLRQIHVGDVIEFTDPMGTAGDERFRTETTVEGIRSKGPRKGLVFNSWSMKSLMDLNHQVRLLKVVWKGKLVDVTSDSVYMPLNGYSLRGGGVQDEAEVMQSTIEEQRRMVKDARNELSVISDQWWADNAAGEEVGREGASAEGQDRHEDPNGGKQCEATKHTSECESWLSEVEMVLNERIKIEKENIETKRRYKPHFSPDQLELVLKICKRVCARSLDDEVPVAIVLGSMADEYKIPDRNLELLIQGDPDIKLREKQIESYLELLVRCLEQ